MNRVLIRYLVIILFYIPFEILNACAVCGGSLTEEETKAYLFSTFLFILVPFIIIFFVGRWIKNNYKNI